MPVYVTVLVFIMSRLLVGVSLYYLFCNKIKNVFRLNFFCKKRLNILERNDLSVNSNGFSEPPGRVLNQLVIFIYIKILGI